MSSWLFGLKQFALSLFDRRFMPTALRVAVFVGSILFVINHGSALLRGEMTQARWISACLTYGVPYLVSIHGQSVSRIKQRQKLKQ